MKFLFFYTLKEKFEKIWYYANVARKIIKLGLKKWGKISQKFIKKWLKKPVWRSRWKYWLWGYGGKRFVYYLFIYFNRYGSKEFKESHKKFMSSGEEILVAS